MHRNSEKIGGIFPKITTTKISSSDTQKQTKNNNQPQAKITEKIMS